MFRIWGLSFIIAISSWAPTLAHAMNPEHLVITAATGARDFFLYLPSKKPVGLVVMLHGCKTNAAQFDQGTEMSKYAAQKNFAVLYPEQNQLANYDHCWNWFWGSETPIIAEGIRLIQDRFQISREQTYLAGMSAGAAQAAILANCNRDLVSKVLLHSGLQFLAATNVEQAQDALEKGSFTSSKNASLKGLHCNSMMKPVSFMVVYGTDDHRVNPLNSIQNVDELLKLNQLIASQNQGSIEIKVSTQNIPTQNGTLGYQKSNYSIGNSYSGMQIKIEGLSHEWSGGNPIQPRNNPNGPNVIKLFLGL
jgi:poly(hydroxyalkanoate) depolymerase family esterase